MLSYGIILVITYTVQNCSSDDSIFLREYSPELLEDEFIDDHYRIAQIEPPATYQIILWDYLKRDYLKRPDVLSSKVLKFLCSEALFIRKFGQVGQQMAKKGTVSLLYKKSVMSMGNTDLFGAGVINDPERYRPCFEEFHSITTDENGQFLLKRKHPKMRRRESAVSEESERVEVEESLGMWERIGRAIAKCLGQDGGDNKNQRSVNDNGQGMEEEIQYVPNKYYHLHIIPMHKKFPLISPEFPFPPIQIHRPGISWDYFEGHICLPHFGEDIDRKCLIDYHPLDHRNTAFCQMLDRWLFGTVKLANAEDAFFVGAYVQYLVTELQRTREAQIQMNSMRQEMKKKYAMKFGGLNLIDELKRRVPASELITRELLQALTDTPPEHDAKYLRKAMQGLGTNEDMLIEILVTRSNKQLRAVKDAYRALFYRELAQEVESETSGTFRKLLLDLLEGDRDESYRTDGEMAKNDAEVLYKAGEGRLGTDEKTFIKIMANQNLAQLRLLFEEYEKKTGHPIEKALRSEFSRDTLSAFLALAEFVRNGPVGQVAKLIQKCIEGKANEDLLVHLIYTYKELNMLDIIADEYNQKFKGPLAKALQDSAKSAILKNALGYLIKRGINH